MEPGLRTTPVFIAGTDGSNPLSSSGESATNLSHGTWSQSAGISMHRATLNKPAGNQTSACGEDRGRGDPALHPLRLLRSQSSNAMLRTGPTKPQDYPE